MPWSERSKENLRKKQHGVNEPEGRSLIILNVPESVSQTDEQSRAKHDFQQWKFLGDAMQVTNVAVIDTFRIPSSPKYEGKGPRPLKLTMLTNSMADAVFNSWNEFRHNLPREIKIIRETRSPKPDKTVAQNITQVYKKNDNAPALVKPAT